MMFTTSLIYFILVKKLVPETSGKSLEEIEEGFK